MHVVPKYIFDSHFLQKQKQKDKEPFRSSYILSINKRMCIVYHHHSSSTNRIYTLILVQQTLPSIGET